MAYYYYEYTEPSKFEKEIVSTVLNYCVDKLKLKLPLVKFVRKTENIEKSIFKHEIDGAGFAAIRGGKNGTIFIVLPTDTFSLIKTVGHECYHVFEGQNNFKVSEEMADKFALKIRKELLT